MTSENLDTRKKVLETLAGKTVLVRPLGQLRPEDSEIPVSYVPLPEYGFALWFEYEKV